MLQGRAIDTYQSLKPQFLAGPKNQQRGINHARDLAVFFALAGIVHLYAPDAFLPIVPDWIPEARHLIRVTGMCEITGAIALLTKRLRRLAGYNYMLAAYAICVFPTSIKHAFYHVHIVGSSDSWWYHAPRLALQPVIVG